MTNQTAIAPAPVAPPPAPPERPRPERFYALDALRGLAIGLMVFVNWAGNWSLPPAFGHAEWHGLTLADTVFPGFLVAMGTAMPYASRAGWRRVLGRALLLILIGSALVSYKYSQPFDLSVGVLQMIGVAYLLTWLVTKLPRTVQTPLVALVLAEVVAAYLWFPVPGVGAGSFEPDSNVASWFDSLLGLAPHPENPHAWLPAVGSVYIGVMAGRISKENSGTRRLGLLAGLSGVTLALGLLLTLVVPLNKNLWTPSFVLVTGGIAVATLVVLALVIPPGSMGGPMRPLVILGGHAIVVYAFSETIIGRMRDYWLWPKWEPFVTERWGELAAGVAFPLVAVLICLLLAWVMELLDIRIRL
ncbi:MAG: heparan-alpha-glucosaminide N-acetyltransferase domain-containing protein [Actinomycetes bacterium]